MFVYQFSSIQLFNFWYLLARTLERDGVSRVDRIGHGFIFFFFVVVNLFFSVCHLQPCALKLRKRVHVGKRQRDSEWRKKKTTQERVYSASHFLYKARPFHHTPLAMCFTSSGYLLNHVNLFKAFAVQCTVQIYYTILFLSLSSFFFLCSLSHAHFLLKVSSVIHGKYCSYYVTSIVKDNIWFRYTDIITRKIEK